MPRGFAPVTGKGNRSPRSLVDELLLTDIMRQTAPVHPYAAGQHQRHDPGPVEQVVVIPVIGSSPDDDQVLAVGSLGVATPFPGKAQQRIAVDSGEFLLPGRR